MNQYILFLLKPVRIWLLSLATRRVLTEEHQQTHQPVATRRNYMHMCEHKMIVGEGKTECMDTQWIRMHPGCLKGLWE